MKIWSKIQRWAVRLVAAVAIGSTVIFLIHCFVAEINVVPTTSMQHTIEPGDWVYVDKLSYGAPIPEHIGQVPVLNFLEYVPSARRKWSEWARRKERFTPFTTIERGDLAIFRSSSGSGVRLIKRVMALPGDTIRLTAGRVYINGRHQPDPPRVLVPPYPVRNAMRAAYPEGTSWTLDDYGPYVVPQGCYFMMGDNRNNSADSRFIGPVPRRQIVGKGHMLTGIRKLKKFFSR